MSDEIFKINSAYSYFIVCVSIMQMASYKTGKIGKNSSFLVTAIAVP